MDLLMPAGSQQPVDANCLLNPDLMRVRWAGSVFLYPSLQRPSEEWLTWWCSEKVLSTMVS